MGTVRMETRTSSRRGGVYPSFRFWRKTARAPAGEKSLPRNLSDNAYQKFAHVHGTPCKG
eukprot:8145165-Alexandrium_andersonii.AAC.1